MIQSNIISNRTSSSIDTFPFSNSIKFYIMILLNNQIQIINTIRLSFGLKELKNSEIKSLRQPHITLLQLFLNNTHLSYTRIFQQQAFYDCIKKSFYKNIIIPNIKLYSDTNNESFKLLGRDNDNQFWTRIYRLDNTNIENVKQFRKDLYNYINKITNNEITNVIRTHRIGTNSKDYIIYSYKGNELYAIIKDQYYTVENWVPHISMLQIKEINNANISKKNTIIKEELSNEKNDIQKSIILKRKINNLQQNSIEMNKDFFKLKIAFGFSDTYEFNLQELQELQELQDLQNLTDTKTLSNTQKIKKEPIIDTIIPNSILDMNIIQEKKKISKKK